MGTAIVVDLRQKTTTFSGDEQLRYVRTHVKAVDGLLDESDMIDINLIPGELKHGLKHGTNISWSVSLSDSFAHIYDKLELYNPSVVEGMYCIIDIGGQFIVPAGHIVTNGDDGGGAITGGASVLITLEKNDWVIYSGVDASDNKLWAIVNQNYPEATITASGLMSATDKVKLNSLFNYDHPTDGIDVSLVGSTIKFVSSLSTDEYGHIESASLATIQTGSESQLGVLQLATQTNIRGATLDTTKAISEARAMDVIHYNNFIKTYDNVEAANASLYHGEGAYVFIKTDEITL